MNGQNSLTSPLLVRLEGSPAATVRLNRPLTIVGSKGHSHLRIIAPEISGSHALLLNLGNNIFVRDLMSRTHVYVNERRVRECRLKFGDVVRFGQMSFRFADDGVLRRGADYGRPRAAGLLLGIEAEPLTRAGPIYVIGRQSGADLVIRDKQVSKAHAVIFEHDGRHVLRDLGSRLGTHLNGNPIRTATLHGGDVIRIGTRVLRFVVEAEEAEDLPQRTDSELPDAESEADAAGESHVFVPEPVLVSDPGEPGPVSDDELDAVDDSADEPLRAQSLGPESERFSEEPTAYFVEDSLHESDPAPGQDAVESPADLLAWGIANVGEPEASSSPAFMARAIQEAVAHPTRASGSDLGQMDEAIDRVAGESLEAEPGVEEPIQEQVDEPIKFFAARETGQAQDEQRTDPGPQLAKREEHSPEIVDLEPVEIEEASTDSTAAVPTNIAAEFNTSFLSAPVDLGSLLTSAPRTDSTKRSEADHATGPRATGDLLANPQPPFPPAPTAESRRRVEGDDPEMAVAQSPLGSEYLTEEEPSEPRSGTVDPVALASGGSDLPVFVPERLLAGPLGTGSLDDLVSGDVLPFFDPSQPANPESDHRRRARSVRLFLRVLVATLIALLVFGAAAGVGWYYLHGA